jgi:hypothetical protein
MSFLCLIVLAKNSSTILSKRGESGHLRPVPDFGGKLSVFPSLV